MESMSLANAIIYEAHRERRGISNATLQKAIYYLNAIHLVEDQSPLTKDNFIKGAYGPINPTVYNKYKQYGSSDITKPQTVVVGYGLNSDGSIRKDFEHPYPKVSDATMEFIHDYLPKVIVRSPFDLVTLAQREPQWQDRTSCIYLTQRTQQYFSRVDHQFWNE